MNQRTPPLRFTLAALLLILPGFLFAQDPQPKEPSAAVIASERLSFHVPRIESSIDRLLALPGPDLPKGETLEQVDALAGDLQNLFQNAKPEVLGGMFKSDKKLMPALSRIYSDARYASRLPPLPTEFQKWLGIIQVQEAITSTVVEAEKVKGQGELTEEKRQKLEQLQKRQEVLSQLGQNISQASTSADLETALGSLSGYFEGSSRSGKAAASGPQATTGLKSTQVATTAPGKMPKITGAPPPKPKAGAQPEPEATSSTFLTSLRVSLDALKRSFPMPFDPASLAEAASVATVRKQSQRAAGSVIAFDSDCSRKEQGLSAKDCQEVRALSDRYRSIVQALNKSKEGKSSGAYYSKLLELNRWNEQVDGFMRGYLAKWVAAKDSDPGFASKVIKATHLEKPLEVVGTVVSPVANVGSSAYYHAAGALSTQVGVYSKMASAGFKIQANVSRFLGMEKLGVWNDKQAASWNETSREYMAYGAATMMQSAYTLMPREWYMALPEVREDLKTFAIANLYDKWGTALPAALYLGYANTDPSNKQLAREVQEGAGGVKGYMKWMLDDASKLWDQGGAGNKAKAAGLWTMVTAVKAGDFAAQSLAFMGVGYGLGTVASKAGTLGTVAKNSGAVYKFATELGKYPFYVGMAKSSLDLGETLITQPGGEAKTRKVMELTADLTAAAGPLALGRFAKQPKKAGAPEVAKTEPGPKKTVLTPEYEGAIRQALGLDAPAAKGPPAAGVSAGAQSSGAMAPPIRNLTSVTRSEYQVDGKIVRRVGAGGFKDVLVHPENPQLVVKVFQGGGAPGRSVQNKNFEVQQTRLLEEIGAAPKTVQDGTAKLNGKDAVGFTVQERVQGSELQTMTPTKYKLVKELFDNLVENRIKLTDTTPGKMEENIMVGTTKSAPDRLKAYVVDADGVKVVPKQGLLEKFTGKPDPLRQFYDGLLTQYEVRLKTHNQAAASAETPKTPQEPGLTKTRYPEGAKPAEAVPETKPEVPSSDAKRTEIPAAKPGEKTAPWGETLTPEQQTSWKEFKQGVLEGLSKEGYDPLKVAEELHTITQGNRMMVRSALLDPATAGDSIGEVIKIRLDREAVTGKLVQEGVQRPRIENWFKRNFMELRGLNADAMEKTIREQFAAIDQVVAKAKELRAKGDNDGILKLADEVERTNPQIADYIKPWKNNAFKNVYMEALAGKQSMRTLYLEYMTAEAEGRVTLYSKARNIEQQRGPTCAIHGLYNILMSQFAEAGIKRGPAYADFEKAVQDLLPKKSGHAVGVKEGLTVYEVQKVAEAVGLQTRNVQKLPTTQTEFESLLASGDGSAYVSIKYAESHGSGRAKSSFHAVFVSGKWVTPEGKTMYVVVDSNGQPSDTAFYTWEQLGPRLNDMVLLKPASVMSLQVKALTFAKPRAPPIFPKKSEPEPTLLNPQEYWKRISEDREFARKKFEENRNLFASIEELQNYARGQALRSKGEASASAVPDLKSGQGVVPADGIPSQKRLYEPSPKHAEGGWGTPNPFDMKTSQELLGTAVPSTKNMQSEALYNMKDKRLIVFRKTTEGVYHAYELPAKDVPGRRVQDVVRQFLEQGKITPAEYRKLIKGQPIQ